MDQFQSLLNLVLGVECPISLNGAVQGLRSRLVTAINGIGLGSQIVGASIYNQVNAGQTNHVQLWGGALRTTDVGGRGSIPIAGTFQRMVIRADIVDQPASGSLVFTLMVNGVASALTVTVAAGTVTPWVASDLTHTVTVSALDQLSIRIVNNAAAASSNINSIWMNFLAGS